MTMEAPSLERQYIDRSVQTSPIVVTGGTTDGSNIQHASAIQDVSALATKLHGLVLSENVPITSPKEDQGVFQDLFTLNSTYRSLARDSVLNRRPTTGFQGPKSTTRIVSLPESAPGFSERKILQLPVKMRTVSMPENSGGHARVAESSFSDQSQGSILPDSEAPARIRVYSGVTDMPHTPSPPSSPDSVEFIGSNPQISDRFLQGNLCTDISSPSIDDDEDDEWASWARSPPRPIPALHGPLSLPYARCPSGAEGTIIEEPDNLPRIIWGLEGDDSNRNRSEVSPARVASISTATQTSRKAATRNNQVNVPPRFNAPRHEDSPDVLRQSLAPPSQQSLQQATSLSSLNAPDFEFKLPASGPIDLSQLTRPHSPVGLKGLLADPHFSSNRAYGHFNFDLQAPAHPADLDLDWQAFNLVPDPSRDSVIGSHSVPSSGLADYLRPPRSSHPGSSLASSRSPIVLDSPSHLSRAGLSPNSPLSSQSTPLHTPLASHNPLQRMSALEIAQKFRQQQIMQHKSMLPTPPSSSSPLWSTAFSPYQDSLWSPEGLTAGHWSGGPARAIRPSNADRLGNASAQNRNVNWSNTIYVPGSTRPEDQISHASDLAFSANAIDLSLLHPGQLNTSQRRFASVSDTAQTALQTRQLPSVHRPPLTTPLYLAKAKQQAAQADLYTSAVPPSSSPSVRGLVHQQPQSVPLNRLIQRRLSSVAEEEYTLNNQRAGMPSSGKPPRLSAAKGSIQRTIEAIHAMPPKKTNVNVVAPRSTPRGPDASRTVPVSDDRLSVRSGRIPANSQLRSREEIKEQDAPKDTAGRGNRGRPRAKARRTTRLPAASNGPERVDGGLTVRS